ELWRGRPFGELADEPWARAEVERLSEVHIGLAERRAEMLLEAGRFSDAVSRLEELARAVPLRERPRALLMRALYQSGRQVEALRAFQDYRALLVDEIGVDPSDDLMTLDRAIATGDSELRDGGATPRSVGAYELHERIGEGAFAVVHRATQPALGRDVAIKVIHAELANRPVFIRRFEAEAQMVARVEHPNIVPLYDYWREPDRAFLVMRWMTGGSLEVSLDDGPWDLDKTVTMVEEVGGALAAAHDAGIVHRDVKPANILLDDQGRSYLADFGIALESTELARPEVALSEGSPIYASPEQLRKEPAGPSTDVYALAIVAYRALSGQVPFPAGEPRSLLQHQLDDPIPSLRSSRPELPSAIDDVLAIATAKRPDDRYPTAPAFALALKTAANGTGGPSAVVTLPAGQRVNPYKGLRPFEETDAEDFHGRERLLDELLDAISDPDTGRLLAVVGPSGSGKSSVVRAALVPALRSGRIAGSQQWFITTMVPGTDPFEAFETALLRVAVNPPASLLNQLRGDPRGILRTVRRVLPADDATMLVVIDQFEELFTSAQSPEHVAGFLEALTVAATEPGSPLRVVLTLRADFYDRPLRHPKFATLFKRGTVAVTPLAPDELEHAIVTPADAVGVDFEPGLVALVAADVGSQPGALPLLQYALTQAFDHADGDEIRIVDYEAVGGLTGSVAHQADQLWTGASAEEQVATRHLFGRLVSPGDGTEDTSRRVRRSELGDDAATGAVIERLGQARLLTFDRDVGTREPTVEIAHEALIREWPRLRVWLDEDRDGLRIHRHLTQAAAGWEERGRDEGDLYRGARLETAEVWVASAKPALNQAESEFLGRSAERREAEVRAERNRVRRLRRLLVTTGIVALVALVAGALAFRQKTRADDQTALANANAELANENADEAAASAADARSARDDAIRETATAQEASEIAAAANLRADLDRLRSAALNEVESNLTLGLLLAAEAYRSDPTLASADALQRVLTASDGLEATMDGAYGLLGLADDGRLAVATRADRIDIWDLTTRSLVRTLEREVTIGSRVETSGTARLIAVSDFNGTDLISIDTGLTVYSDERQLDGLSFSTDGRELAVFTANSMEIWDIAEPASPRVVDTVDGGFERIAWHPDGSSYVLVRGDGRVEYWDRGGDDPSWTFDGPAGTAGPSIYTADGKTVVITIGE
ncbi:MAG: BTAD domain-containing putative transcriptional regulator, partial [Acidimicrobiales bacterium]